MIKKVPFYLEKVVSTTDITVKELKRALVSFKLCFGAEENLVLNNKNNRVFLSLAYRFDSFPLEI